MDRGGKPAYQLNRITFLPTIHYEMKRRCVPVYLVLEDWRPVSPGTFSSDLLLTSDVQMRPRPQHSVFNFLL